VDLQDKRERFEAGYRHTYAPLVAYARRRTSGPADAADVVAETFSVYWRRIEDAPTDDRLLPWLYGVGRRVLANQRRGDLRRTALHDRLAADVERMAQHPLPETSSGTDIDRAFRKLDRRDQEILALVAWEGLDREAVAVALRLSRAAVRVRLYRARQHFAHELEKQGVEVPHSAPTTTTISRAQVRTNSETS
jgi:RNA polymerase sigma factor (sigma-70 family)